MQFTNANWQKYINLQYIRHKTSIFKLKYIIASRIKVDEKKERVKIKWNMNLITKQSIQETIMINNISSIDTNSLNTDINNNKNI